MENHSHESQHCRCACVCHMMSGIMLSLIGLIFLLGGLEVISQSVVGIAWPILVILIGLMKALGRGKCKCC